MAVNIPKSFGALLLGGLYACLRVYLGRDNLIRIINSCRLSGFVFVQIVIYFKLYPKDLRQIKSLVRLYFVN